MKSARHDALLTLEGGEEYRVLFTMHALADAETRTGKQVVTLAQAAMAGNLGVTDVAQLFVAGLEEARRALRLGGKPYQLRQGLEIMERAGFTAVATVVFEGLANVLGYDPADEDADDSADPPER